jgi:hypothetical protein
LQRRIEVILTPLVPAGHPILQQVKNGEVNQLLFSNIAQQDQPMGSPEFSVVSEYWFPVVFILMEIVVTPANGLAFVTEFDVFQPAVLEPHPLDSEPQLLPIVDGVFVGQLDHPNVNIHGRQHGSALERQRHHMHPGLLQQLDRVFFSYGVGQSECVICE